MLALRLETLYLTHARHAYMVRFLVQCPHLDSFASEPLFFFQHVFSRNLLLPREMSKVTKKTRRRNQRTRNSHVERLT